MARNLDSAFIGIPDSHGPESAFGYTLPASDLRQFRADAVSTTCRHLKPSLRFSTSECRDRICVNAIAPDVFPTELNSKLLQSTKRGEEILLRTPMARFGEPRELVGTSVLFSSEAASFITGQYLAVDGGYLASGVNS